MVNRTGVKVAPNWPRLVLATANPHKLREVTEILSAPGVDALGGLELVTSGDLGLASPVEDGITFQQNALLKARAVVAATGLPALADDSGLCVEVLGGAPGVFSARWAGSHGDDAANLALLLDQLQDVPDKYRGAWFECAACLAMPDGRVVVQTGQMPGTLARAPRGEGGFGYDPILVPDGYTKTSAELTAEQKNAISHRGQALRALAPLIAQLAVPAPAPKGAKATRAPRSSRA
ncbi:MAG: RdgB/HAM1 family non-canonical purine NTP pyrophosphatase [Bifidobacteriaceae bacterium]|jgi:XTP/dITP diphosphohydrolase|nr:RdgB/HAM1 family non-canonical purine NTP pyrophosphatase [Bifidobacteriaceae bacterium]